MTAVPPPVREAAHFLNEVPEHMAQEFDYLCQGGVHAAFSSMKFLSTWLRNGASSNSGTATSRSSMKFLSTWLRNFRFSVNKNLRSILNEVPEHMAQEFFRAAGRHDDACPSSMKFLSTWLRNSAVPMPFACRGGRSSMKFLSTWLRNWRFRARVPADCAPQ